MKQIKMKFKDFEFPANPSVIEVKHSRNINESPLFENDSFVSNVSRNAAVIKGEGSFSAKMRLNMQANLKRLIKATMTGGSFFLTETALRCFSKN